RRAWVSTNTSAPLRRRWAWPKPIDPFSWRLSMSSDVSPVETALPTAPLPPGPRSFGDILKIIGERKKDPFALYLRLIQEYGDVIYFKVGSIGYCLVNDPECIKKVLHEGLRNYPKGPGYERLRVLLGQGLLTGEGEAWKRQRKLAQPAFHHTKIV